MNEYSAPNQPSPEQTTFIFKTIRIVWYIFYVLEALLAFRFALKLLGANAGAGFTDFIYTVSSVPLAPFQFVFSNNAVGGSVIEWSTLLAMAVYWALVWGIIKLVLISRKVDTRRAEVSIEKQDEI
ncbi:MAG: YggT family protein [Candidatus Paceibacterota bacterium]